MISRTLALRSHFDQVFAQEVVGSAREKTMDDELFSILSFAYNKAYGDEDINKVVEIVRLRFMYHQQDILEVIRSRQEGSADYVEKYDWLYSEPEVLMIADLALSYPKLLESVVKNSNFEDTVDVMMDEFISKVGNK